MPGRTDGQRTRKLVVKKIPPGGNIRVARVSQMRGTDERDLRGGQMPPLDQGDTMCQAALAHLAGLYGFAMSLSHNQAEAEDLVQETYLRAVRAFDRLRPESNLKSWLYTIMRNTWLNLVRHTRSGPQFIDDQEQDTVTLAKSSDDPHTEYVAGIEREHVRAAVESLPQAYREVVMLREFEGFSYEEIAEILGCAAGTVTSRLARGRDRLRAALSQWKIRPERGAREADNA